MSKRTITIVSRNKEQIFICSSLQIVKRQVSDLSDFESPYNYWTDIVNEDDVVVAKYPSKQCIKIMQDIIALLEDETKDHIVYTLPEGEPITEPCLWQIRREKILKERENPQ